MARDDLHFRLRIPEDLKNLIEEAAAKNLRSMTAEIVSRLYASFEDNPEHLSNEAWERISTNLLISAETIERVIYNSNISICCDIDSNIGIYIKSQEADGRKISRDAAINEIIQRYLNEHGYTQ